MRRIYFTKTKLEQHYLRLFELALILPTLIVGASLYYVIFHLMTEQLGIPEIVATHLTPVVDKVNLAMMIVLPIVLLILFAIGVILTRNLAGPIERVDRELQEIISENLFSKRLRLREKDVLKPLANHINVLLDKIEKKSAN
jgi:methyl-accepting chemotaxis protein